MLLATGAQLRTSEHYPALPLQVMNSFPGCKMLVFCGFLKGRWQRAVPAPTEHGVRFVRLYQRLQAPAGISVELREEHPFILFYHHDYTTASNLQPDSSTNSLLATTSCFRTSSSDAFITSKVNRDLHLLFLS